MKKLRRKTKKKISMGISVFCVIVAGCMALLLTPIFSVDTITVTGNKTIASEDIVRGSGIVRGSNIFSVSLSAVQDRISCMSGIDSVKVRRSLPSTIRITVIEGNPIVYIEDQGNLVGLTADGKVVEVISAVSLPSSAPKPPADENVDEDNPEEPKEAEDDGEDEPQTEASAETPPPVDKTVVYGMGEMKYQMGKAIEFSDNKKADDLMKLMGEFLKDDVGREFTLVDMSVYENITLVYQGRLKVRLGSSEQLGYKLACFKEIVGQQLGENPEGTLDLQRLTYNPKKE